MDMNRRLGMLTIDEKLLMEGVDAWVAKPENDLFLRGVLAISMSKSQQEGKERIDELYEDKDRMGRDSKLRRERGTLLKAKLIMLRDKVMIEEEIA